jgi:hypothetical protein
MKKSEAKQTGMRIALRYYVRCVLKYPQIHVGRRARDAAHFPL